MDAVSVAAGVILLLFGQWLPLLPVDWRVAVFSIFWELRDVEHLYIHTPASQTLDYLLNYPHHVFICVFAPVSLLRDRLCLMVAVLATRPAPLFATAMRIELPTVFNVHQQLILDLLGSENKQIQGLETPGMSRRTRELKCCLLSQLPRVRRRHAHEEQLRLEMVHMEFKPIRPCVQC